MEVQSVADDDGYMGDSAKHQSPAHTNGRVFFLRF